MDNTQNIAAVTAGWKKRAPRKTPDCLHQLSQNALTALTAALLPSGHASPRARDGVRAAGDLLRCSLPDNLRTCLLRTLTTSLPADSNHLVSLLTLSILTDVTHIDLRAPEVSTEIQMEPEDSGCDFLSQVLSSVEPLKLESLHLEGVSLRQGVLGQVLSKAPRLRSLRVSGDLATEALNYLKESGPCHLHHLHLSSCAVTDEEVVSSLVGTHKDLTAMGQLICSNQDLQACGGPAKLSTLRTLTVLSPMVSVGGALVLLFSLRNLRQLHYTWMCPVGETILLLRKVCPSLASYALTTLDMFQPCEDTLNTLASACQGLRTLQIEGNNSNTTSLGCLASFQRLSTLTLRLVPADHIVSAVQAIGINLQTLKVEFEEHSFQPLPLDTIKQECPNLHTLELLYVTVDTECRGHDHKKSSAFPNLRHLTMKSLTQPAALERLLADNSVLEDLVLDVNQDALTDQVVSSLLRNNDLRSLASLRLEAGCVTVISLLSLMSLPCLSSLSLDLKRFPFVSTSVFRGLQEALADGNFLCAVQNVSAED